MNTDILLVRDGDGFRILHGYLRLVALLSRDDKVPVDVKGENSSAMIQRTPEGLRVAIDDSDREELPLLWTV